MAPHCLENTVQTSQHCSQGIHNLSGVSLTLSSPSIPTKPNYLYFPKHALLIIHCSTSLHILSPTFSGLPPPSPFVNSSSYHNRMSVPLCTTTGNAYILIFIPLLLVSYCGCKKLLWTFWLKTTQSCSLTVLDVISLQRVLQGQYQGARGAGSFWRLKGKIRSLPLTASRGCWHFLACGHITLFSWFFCHTAFSYSQISIFLPLTNTLGITLSPPV